MMSKTRILKSRKYENIKSEHLNFEDLKLGMFMLKNKNSKHQVLKLITNFKARRFQASEFQT